MQHPTDGYYRDIVSFPHIIGLAEGNSVWILRNVSLRLVQGLVFEKDHRIVVADRLNQKSLGVVWS